MTKSPAPLCTPHESAASCKEPSPQGVKRKGLHRLDEIAAEVSKRAPREARHHPVGQALKIGAE